MTRLMADSVNAYGIPLGFRVVGGYDDANFKWSPEEWARFPGALQVHIETGAAETFAPVIDVEQGDYLPWDAPAAVERKRAQGIDPTVYVSFDLWAPTQTEFRSRGVAEPHWWVALWDGVMELIPGSVASQRQHPPLSGGPYDLSVVADFWPGIDGTYGPGGGNLPDDMFEQADRETVNAGYKASRYGLNPDDSPSPFAAGIKERFDQLDAKLSALPDDLKALNAGPALRFSYQVTGDPTFAPASEVTTWAAALSYAEALAQSHPGATVVITAELSA